MTFVDKAVPLDVIEWHTWQSSVGEKMEKSRGQKAKKEDGTDTEHYPFAIASDIVSVPGDRRNRAIPSAMSRRPGCDLTERLARSNKSQSRTSEFRSELFPWFMAIIRHEARTLDGFAERDES